MKINNTNRNTWLALYEAAGQFEKLAPWQWMYDSDIFGVEDPVSGETGWCMVMGNAGEVFALAVYWGDEGFISYLNLLDAHYDTASDTDRIIAAMAQKMLKIEFVNRPEMTREDLEQLKTLVIKFRGENQWVQVREMNPGYHPWYVSDEQAAYLVHALHQAVDVTARFQKNRGLLHSHSEKKLVRVPVKTAGGIEWQDQYKAEPKRVKEKTRTVNPILVERAKKELKRKNAAVCFSLAYMPGGVRAEKGKRHISA